MSRLAFDLLSNAKDTASAAAQNLRRLILIRSIIVIGIAAVLAYSVYYRKFGVPLMPVLSFTVLLALINVLSYWRLRQSWPVTEPEFFAHLLCDLVVLGWLLYWSGGASNPFVSYFLVLVMIAAATLQRRYTLIIALATVAIYTLLLFQYRELPFLSPQHGVHAGHAMSQDAIGGINPHIFGMWINYVVSVLFVSVFVVAMAEALRVQKERVNRIREQELRNEQILGLASLAAGTAHELRTPLSSMTVLTHDLIHSTSDPQFKQELELLESQLQTCNGILRKMVDTAEQNLAQDIQSQALNSYVMQLLDSWQLLRPGIKVNVAQSGKGDPPMLQFDATLNQAIINLLNNAADESRQLDLSIDWTDSESIIRIRDYGSGLPADVESLAGKSFHSTKATGLGVGLLLSHATVERFGGTLAIYSHVERGTVMELRLPIPAAQDMA